ncbi:I78 family peptidase inhibitor [Hyphomonas sp.]|uniref:I78 family peptidase inhibitor n=1 Tax=Hyphomonas sp. TaxID=87 RepID=UPI003D2952EE
MRRLASLLPGLALMMVAACSAPVPVEPEAEAPSAGVSEPDSVAKPEMDVLDRVEDTCGMAAFESYIGQPAASIPAVDLPDRARIVGPDTQVTMDYVEGRLNVLTDEAGTVIGLKCG